MESASYQITQVAPRRARSRTGTWSRPTSWS